MTESDIQRQIIKYAESEGYLAFRMNAGFSGRYNTRLAPVGTPDLAIAYPDGFIWVEVKQSTGKVSEAQQRMHERLRALGQTVVIAWCLDDFIEAVK